MWRCKAQNLWSKGLWYNERHLLWLYQRKTDFAHDFHWLQDFPGLEWEISSWVGCGFLVSDSPPTSLPPALHNDQACCCLSWGGGGCVTECRDEFKFSIVSWVYGSAVIFPNQVELEEAADLVLFLMDHTFLADDHLALNETTFTWPDRIFPIIKMR